MASRRRWITFAAWLLLPAALLGQQKGHTIFRFQSGFWSNLHHFLIQHALEPAADEPTAFMPLTPSQAEAWSRALGYYAEAFRGKDLLQRDMAAIKNALSDSGNDFSLEERNLDPDIVKVLEAAAPVYRILWRREHDPSNRAWIRRLRPLLTEHEEVLKERLATVYATAWPERAIRVDIVFHAN